jgi:hypothetical protein
MRCKLNQDSAFPSLPGPGTPPRPGRPRLFGSRTRARSEVRFSTAGCVMQDVSFPAVID